jgi:hypothetical protein
MSVILYDDNMTEFDLDEMIANPKIVESEEFQRGFKAGFNEAPYREQGVIFMAGAYAGALHRHGAATSARTD